MAGIEDAVSNTDLIALAWIVIAAPFATGALLMFLRLFEIRKSLQTKTEFKLSENLTGGIGVLGLGISLVFSIIVAIQYFSNYLKDSIEHGVEAIAVEDNYAFIPTAEGAFEWGILLSPLTVIMMLLLAVIAFLIHYYAWDYMHGDKSFSRFFSSLNLFTGSMFGFVLASNLFMGFVFWELLGFTSYLLIGYYWRKASASAAAKKAFLYNKVGDVSFMIGIALIWAITYTKLGDATLGYWDLRVLISEGDLSFADMWLPALLIFGGAIGKSAQLPLFGWLAEAMEGPTPVSALLHSSTMVKAGLFLTAQIFFLFYGVDADLHIIPLVGDAAITANVVAWLGTFTALVGALIAVTQTDIKKILAFSTISQLGYIALALGAGGITVAFYHLISHATFKSLLFLGAGAVIHSVHSQELDDMGGLRKYMPWTHFTMAVGLLGLAGVPFMSGFWSKDAVLLAMETSQITGHAFLFWVAVVTAGITAFYSAKLYILTFRGEPKYDKEHVHPAPTSPKMRNALIVLAALVIIESIWFAIGTIRQSAQEKVTADFINFEYFLGSLLGQHGEPFQLLGAAISTGAVLIGGSVAYVMYSQGGLQSFQQSGIMQTINNVAKNRFYFDKAIYWFAEVPIMWIGDRFTSVDKNVIDGVVIDGLVTRGAMVTATASDGFDQGAIDGAVNFFADITRVIGREFRKVQSGLAPIYARIMIVGVGLILSYYSVTYFLSL